MAEDMTQEPTVESVPAAQEPSAAVEGESQQVQADQSTASVSEQVQPETAPSDSQEIEEWNGNDVDQLPKPLQARARGMLRYLHKVSQEAASVKQQAQAFNEIVNHPEFQEFIQWKEQRGSVPQTETPQVSSEPLSEDDFLAAQTDPAKFVEVQQKLLMQQAAPVINELKSVKQQLEAMQREKAQEQAARKLDAFASQHPDFWKINPTIMKAVLEEVVQKKGGSIEDAYNHAKALEKQYLEQAKTTIKQEVETKKKAVSASPSKSLEPEVIYVKDSREATRVAFENAKLGKRVDVRVKR